MSFAECRYVECHYDERHYAECLYAECHYAECHNTECRGAVLSTVHQAVLCVGKMSIKKIRQPHLKQLKNNFLQNVSSK